MSVLRTLAPAGVALLLLLGVAPAARAEAAPATTTSPVQAAPGHSSAASEASGDYAAREAKAPELAKFEGGEYEHVYIGSSVVVVLLVVLIIVLVI